MASELPIIERLERQHALTAIAPSLGPAPLNPDGAEAAQVIRKLYEALARVAAEASLDSPDMWDQVESALAKAQGAQ